MLWQNQTFCACHVSRVSSCDVNVSIPYVYNWTLSVNVTVYDNIEPVCIGINLLVLRQLILHNGIQKILEKNVKEAENMYVKVIHRNLYIS